MSIPVNTINIRTKLNVSKSFSNLKYLRLSLKYRPEIFRLILKLRHCVRKKNVLIKKLKYQLKQAEIKPEQHSTDIINDGARDEKSLCYTLDGSTQTVNIISANLPPLEDVTEKLKSELTSNVKDISLMHKQNDCDMIEACTQTFNMIPIHYTSLENITEEIEIKTVESPIDIIEESVTHTYNVHVSCEASTQTYNMIPVNFTSIENDTEEKEILEKKAIVLDKKDCACQTDEKPIEKIDDVSKEIVDAIEGAGWHATKENGGDEKSVAEQVKEVAQSVLQQSGMVYVESAGMYYDYKTGYYYNSELGLYYHTETSCYYYYSEDKKEFVFHSYPDRSAATPTSRTVHPPERRAKKHKKVRKTDEDVDNLTKNLSQDKEDRSDSESRKKRRKIKTKTCKKKKQKDEKQSETIAKKDEKVDELKDLSKETTDIVDEPVEEINSGDKEMEDGECSASSSEDLSDEESKCSTSTASDDECVAKHHPPCMRVVVRETTLPKLKVGSLFLVTKDGGTVGREGDQHTILLRDTNVSRNHLDIKYDLDRRMYLITDLGSKNGTILNGARMSESQVISSQMEVVHGSVIQLGDTKLLCHIHPGTDTCGHCEPGLIMEMEEKEGRAAYTRTCSVQRQHQLELARLKNKYAPQPLMLEDGTYNDRARARRETVGSSHASDKTQTADVDTCIAPENKGFKLLEKMGWSKGEGLGKDCQGDTEPIPLVGNEGKAGLGTEGASVAPAPASVSFSALKKPTNKLGTATLRLASKTKMLKPPAKAFQTALEASDSE